MGTLADVNFVYQFYYITNYVKVIVVITGCQMLHICSVIWLLWCAQCVDSNAQVCVET